MQSFVYSYPTKVYFGQGAARQALEAELGSYGPNVLLAYGGGSVIDCCKIVAAQAKTDEDVWEMEFTHRRFPAEVIPMGAVVTASGTGAADPAPRPPAGPGFIPFPHPDTIPTVPARLRQLHSPLLPGAGGAPLPGRDGTPAGLTRFCRAPAGRQPGAPPPGRRHSLWQEVFSYA